MRCLTDEHKRKIKVPDTIHTPLLLAYKGKQAKKKNNQNKNKLQQPLSVCTRMYVCVCVCVSVCLSACTSAYVCAFNNALNPPAIIDFNDKTYLCFIYRFLTLIAFKCLALLNTCCAGEVTAEVERQTTLIL